jgi:hypothetical protein
MAGYYYHIVGCWRGGRRGDREAEEARWDWIELLSDVQSCAIFLGYVAICWLRIGFGFILQSITLRGNVCL